MFFIHHTGLSFLAATPVLYVSRGAGTWASLLQFSPGSLTSLSGSLACMGRRAFFETQAAGLCSQLWGRISQAASPAATTISGNPAPHSCGHDADPCCTSWPVTAQHGHRHQQQPKGGHRPGCPQKLNSRASGDKCTEGSVQSIPSTAPFPPA